MEYCHRTRSNANLEHQPHKLQGKINSPGRLFAPFWPEVYDDVNHQPIMQYIRNHDYHIFHILCNFLCILQRLIALVGVGVVEERSVIQGHLPRTEHKRLNNRQRDQEHDSENFKAQCPIYPKQCDKGSLTPQPS
jgi:hypothetical protein